MVDMHGLEEALRTGDWLEPQGQDDNLDAKLIRSTLLKFQGSGDPRGLRIKDMHIRGKLDLAGMQLPHNLEMVSCHFDTEIELSGASLKGLNLSGSHLMGLRLFAIRAEGSILLIEAVSQGPVMASQSRIQGQLCLDLLVINSDIECVVLDGAKIAHGLTLNGAKIDGEVRAVGAEVNGIISMDDAVIENFDGDALCLDRARILGSVRGYNVTMTGALRAVSMDITGSLELDGAVITNRDCSIVLRQSKIGQDLDLTGVSLFGPLLLDAIQLGSALIFETSVVDSPAGISLSLARAELGGGLSVSSSAFKGQIFASSLEVGAGISLRNVMVRSQDPLAMILDSATVREGFLSRDCVLLGGIQAIGASFARRVELKDLKISSQFSLVFDDCDFGGDFTIRNATLTGEVRALNARVRGQLRVLESSVEAPDGDAVSFNTAVLTDLAVFQDLELTGTLQLTSSRSENGLILNDIKVTTASPVAIALQDATTSTLRLGQLILGQAGLDLGGARISHLKVEDASTLVLPRIADAQGLSIASWSGFVAGDRKAARAWLDTISSLSGRSGQQFQGQPWREFARLYRDAGRPEDARWLQFCAALRITASSPVRSKLIRIPYGLLVGFGYYPLLVIPWLVIAWLVVFGVVSSNQASFTPTASNASTMSVVVDGRVDNVYVTGATNVPKGYPKLRPSIIALETALPAISAGQTNAWRVTGSSWLPLVLAAVRAFGWLLTALLLAGLTGILRKE
ncbi:hypothetical protein [Frigoribacterium sp. CFBP 13707]|uniref:hypothetical protein n=1 Tax=Frigoribacterium sp. CFBP 13707 TaxID=2775313 RepID=UPI001780AAEF|nr:hypothetical protein [Frigoribacterium sp. CFBP 13707]MBD8729310.1 hypothetical protein [Frigoribacterium sp. CFBP 13707]